MPETVYAAFTTAAQAERAAGSLLDHGVAAKDISLVLSEEAKESPKGFADSPALGSQPIITAAGEGGLGTFDPLGNELRLSGATPPIPGGNMFPIGETAEVNHDLSNDLNPAQNDYPRTGSDSPTELSSRPPDSKYDWNADLDKKSYNKDYEQPLSEKGDDEIRAEGDRDRARVDPASVKPENDEGTIADEGATPTQAVAVVPTSHHAVDVESLNEAGVTTTTIKDAANVAAKGVAAGIGLGALAAVAAISLPGLGLVLGGGALAVAVAGLSASASGSGVAGGIVTYLKEQGVPADQISGYQTAYENGGAILSVAVEDGVGRSTVENLLRQAGGSNVHPFAYTA